MSKGNLGLEPVSMEELNDYYGSGFCPEHNDGKPGPYDAGCCWHDCKNGDNENLSTQHWTAWK